jgi:hypothetical protein
LDSLVRLRESLTMSAEPLELRTQGKAKHRQDVKGSKVPWTRGKEEDGE